MQMMRLARTLARFWVASMVVVGMMLLGMPALGQTNYGAVVGSVADTTGAAVPGATVTLTNSGTNVKATTQSGAAGTYSFLNLIPGTYALSATQAGFKGFTTTKIDVTIGGTTRVDAALTIGDTTQTVTVEAESSTDLHTDSATLDGVIEGRQVLDSPLNGRNVNNLLDFVPGVTPGGGTQGSTVANGGSGNFQAGGQTQAIAYGNYQIGGGFSGQSLFFIDGMGQNVPENNVNALVPTQDAVQEFRVSTNNISPEFGGFGGGVIQISTKSGTNNFHGNVYEYLRNTALDANDWFSNHDGLGKAPLRQNQYGANLAGPIFKNKAFFFFSWEHEKLISASPDSVRVPTTAELGGNFAADFPAGTQGIYNPATRAPYANNAITPTALNQTALTILKLETPNEALVNQNTNPANPLAPNFFAEAPIEGYQNQFNARVDYALGKTDQLFARFTYWNPHNGISDPLGTRVGSGTTGNLSQEGVMGDTHQFNASTIADLHVSYLENYNFQNILSNGFNQSSINSNYGAIQSQSFGGIGTLPGLSITGYGVGASTSQLYWENTIYAVSGSLSKVAGRHTIRGGGSWRQSLWTTYGNNGGLGLSALPSYTASSSSDAATGNALASFLLNTPSSTSISEILTQHSFLHTYAFYVNDTYQATSKLTITAGLRWEQPGSYSEENNLNTVMLPTAAATVGGLTSITNPQTGTAVPLTGTLALVDSAAYPSRREEALHWKLFSPRVGFAYRLDDKTVVRSGYGISFLPAEITQDGPQLSPVGRSITTVTNPTGTNTTVAPLQATVDNPLPNGVNEPLGHTQAALNAQLGFGLWARVPNQAYGYAQQWNLALERAVTPKTTVSVAYAGAKGTHLVGASAYTASGLNLNQLPDQYDSLGAGLLTAVANPFYGQFPSTSLLGSPTVAQGYLLLPHPQYPQGMLQQVPRFGDSTYHALQVSATRRFAHQGVLQGAYTWSKLISNVDNTSAFQDGQGGTAVVQDNDNLRAEKSLSEQDLANNLVINYGIDLPYGHGETYGSKVNGFVNAALGGWRVGGITILKSGLPLALVAQSNELSQFGGGTAGFGLGPGIIRPNYTAGCNKTAAGAPHSNARVNAYFNTACFTQPGAYSFGNEGRVDSQLKSEGELNFDVSVNKSFDVTQRVKLKFTSEIFDLFNHAQFGEPNLAVGGSGFGTVTHQNNLPRTVQFALRASF
jgi:hypothetical protein